MPVPGPTRVIRCAIYTRKSTDEGLEQAFNSLDAQREAGEAFIASQRHQSWTLLAERFDDGGYSGGTMERPALQRLVAAVEARQVDCVVVYKVDRLSRSLLDFARIIGVLEKHGASFVSVTQQFNTTASIGRLTLNILLSFAQFERELISERTRDKMAAARRKGKWVGGVPPLGYAVAAGGGRLVVKEEEAVRVREMFALYRERRSVLAVTEELNRRGWTTKQWISRRGRIHPGHPFTKTSVSHILHNLVYTGKVPYRGGIYSGEHAGIVEEAVWEEVQLTLRSRPSQQPMRPVAEEAPLRGLLYCAQCGVRMVPTRGTKEGRQYRYYVCWRAQKQGWKSCPTKSVSAPQIEQAVWTEVQTILQRNGSTALAPYGDDASGEGLRLVIERITYDRSRKVVRLRVRAECGGGEREISLVRLGHGESLGRLPRITRLMALAIRYEELLRTGAVRDYAELARCGRVSRARLTQIMNLLNLASPIQEQILMLDGMQGSRDPICERDLRKVTAVLEWPEQLAYWDALRSASGAGAPAHR